MFIGLHSTATDAGEGLRPDKPAASLSLLVAGQSSDNIVRFDLATGEATVVARLANGSRPRSIAVNQQGEIFVGLRGNKKNVVRLASGRAANANGPLVAIDFTPTIGRYGPGLMAFDRDGLLAVAGDTKRAVLRFNVKTGKRMDSMTVNGCCNLVGLHITGDHLYAAEYFQKTVLRFNLAGDPVGGARFISRSPHLNRPHGMAIGHNGNLFVSSLLSNLIHEYRGEDGKFMGKFIDTRTVGAGHVNHLHFDTRLQHFFFTSHDVVYELSADGALLARYQNPALTGAQAVAIVPVPVPAPASAVETTGIRPGP